MERKQPLCIRSGVSYLLVGKKFIYYIVNNILKQNFYEKIIHFQHFIFVACR